MVEPGSGGGWVVDLRTAVPGGELPLSDPTAATPNQMGMLRNQLTYRLTGATGMRNGDAAEAAAAVCSALTGRRAGRRLTSAAIAACKEADNYQFAEIVADTDERTLQVNCDLAATWFNPYWPADTVADGSIAIPGVHEAAVEQPPPEAYVCFDVETTGFDADGDDRIVDVAMVKLRPDTLEQSHQISSLINPGRSNDAVHVNEVTDEMLADAPTFAEYAPQLAFEMENCVLVAHNLTFDAAFMRAEFQRAGIEVDLGCGIDTMTLTQGRNLADARAAYGVPAGEVAHRALPDAQVVAGLLRQVPRTPFRRLLTRPVHCPTAYDVL